MFIAFFVKTLVRAIRVYFAHISMTTQARDFKFAGAIVQRLMLVMVALTQNFFSAHYAWFSRGRSHISKYLDPPALIFLKYMDPNA